jgi:ketosteroid isomerase-like protein
VSCGQAITKESVEVVRVGFEAWSSGGVEALLELIDAEIEWTVRPDLPDASVYRGHDELRQLFARFEEVLDAQWVEPQEFIEAGRASVVVRFALGRPRQGEPTGKLAPWSRGRCRPCLGRSPFGRP